MTSTWIVLIRHGESRAQEERFVGGRNACTGLSDRGRRQVEALRDRLASTGELDDTTALYASTMPRAVETATILAPALGLTDVVEHDDFCEHHMGAGDGLTWDEFNRLHPRPQTWDADRPVAPGAESFADMHSRVGRALDMLLERHRGERVVVACHGGVVVHAMIRCLALNPSPHERATLDVDNTAITELRATPDADDPTHHRISLARFNDFAHVADML